MMNLNVLLGENEDSASSMISNTATITTREGSDSNDITPFVPPPKRLKSTLDPTPSSRFKGVVVQQNGHWGAQIYADHRRIWLGTFRSEEAAAVAYDRAATKLCHDDAHRNFPLSPSTFEPFFQHLHPTDAVLNMIRDGSYDTKFAEFMYRSGHSRSAGVSTETGTITHELFQKQLTPSDVGKLNRLVIPKKHAVRYFPPIKAASNGDHEPEGEGAEGMMLEFKDRQGRKWDFRYCYWKSSQSFVFTKGWNKFVKTKELAAKDTVVFYRHKERAGTARPFCMIDVEYTSHDEAEVVVGRREVEEKTGFKLFGVHIC